MASLKELVEKHGFGIVVQSFDKYNPPFTIIGENENPNCYNAEYSHPVYKGKSVLIVLKECLSTNDYELVE
jgi:hypothetical protein